ncbi:MAG: XdhC/CoxI family protein [Candidatus Limnocylindrales bacterium]|jgi:xanthine dehydrogenase accessory factor
MKELVETLAAWRAEGAQIGRAVVVRTFFSVPRPEGAVMLVTADGRIAGSVSGGCVEGAAVEEIERARATGRSRVVRYGISDEQAWDVGLACGGTIDVLVEPAVSEAAEAAARAVAGTGATGGRAVITPLPADSPGPEIGPHPPGEGEPPAAILVAWEDGHLDGSLGDPSLDAELVRLTLESLASGTSRTVELAGRSLFIEAFPTRARLIVVGAGQVAIPLVAIARTLGYETIVIDGRPAFATRERFPDVDRLIVGWPDEVADAIGLGPSDAVAVLSHDAKFDEPAIATAFARRCRYVGAIGSRKRLADRRERLVAAGVRREDLERLRSPIGLDLGGRAPAETALSIMAEIVAMRYGGTALAVREQTRAKADPASSAAPSAPVSRG